MEKLLRVSMIVGLVAVPLATFGQVDSTIGVTEEAKIANADAFRQPDASTAKTDPEATRTMVIHLKANRERIKRWDAQNEVVRSSYSPPIYAYR
jgi:hypothetical protein